MLRTVGCVEYYSRMRLKWSDRLNLNMTLHVYSTYHRRTEPNKNNRKWKKKKKRTEEEQIEIMTKVWRGWTNKIQRFSIEASCILSNRIEIIRFFNFALFCPFCFVLNKHHSEHIFIMVHISCKLWWATHSTRSNASMTSIFFFFLYFDAFEN